jgi:hypothetical protein
MTSPLDFAGIVDQEVNLRKAQAIARGTAQYFLSIRLPYEWPPTPPTTTTTQPTTTTTESTAATTTTTTAALPTNKEEE